MSETSGTKMVICSNTKDRRTWRRKNGWSLPLHLLQILAWIFIVMFSVLYFGILVPSVPCKIWQIICYSVNGGVFLVHIIIHLVSVSFDPADANVRAKSQKNPLPTFDHKKHSHVIENQYCYICEVKVGRKSKHCSACNKCVSGFDHHCKWLNNCVGERNYRLFLSCITTALLACMIIFVLAITLLAAYFDSDSWLYTQSSDNSEMSANNVSNDVSTIAKPTLSPSPFHNETLYGHKFTVFVVLPVHHVIWALIVICSAILSLIAIALLGHLLGFHIFLMCQNFSTYDYIVQKRDNVAPTQPEHSQNQQGSKFISLPFRLLQQIKSKKANQVTPESRNQKDEHIEEIELQKNSQRRSTHGKSLILPVSIESDITNDADQSETSLDKSVGNVYIGSPHRRRHYLEPLNVQPKNSSPNSKGGTDKLVSNEISNIETLSKTRSFEVNSDDSENGSSSELVQGPLYQSFTHDQNRRHLRSPSPAPILSPIMESEIATGSTIVSWKYRSVSEQSLNILNEDDEDSEGTEATPSPSQPIQTERNGNLSRDNSGSLSNLFVSVNGQTEVTIENNNNNLPSQTNLKLEEDNRVHEVHIIPQGTFNGFPESKASNENLKKEECGDPFINGELWAYAPRNGCRLPSSVMFRRSSSMQDETANNSQAHLTRCRSEDAIKTSPRVIRLQRRLSEDQNSWMSKDADRLSKKLKDCPPKSGISATAMFCVEESDDSFSMPNMVIGSKRKYGHFTKPNHVVLPCMNSIHPESRKRTRQVGSKPPKAFHA